MSTHPATINNAFGAKVPAGAKVRGELKWSHHVPSSPIGRGFRSGALKLLKNDRQKSRVHRVEFVMDSLEVADAIMLRLMQGDRV